MDCGVFKATHTYVFLASNGRFLSRIDRGLQHIEAEKAKIDVHCRFRVSVIGNGRVAFKADDGGFDGYLSRIDRGVQNVEAAKPHIDIHCEFSVETDSGPSDWNRARYVYLKADNGKYWGIVEREGRNNIEACYDFKEKKTRFIVLEAM